MRGDKPSQLLHHLNTVCKTQSAEGLRLPTLEVIPKLDLASTCTSLNLQGCRNVLKLLLDSNRVRWFAFEQRKNLEGLFTAVFGHEETRGLREPDQEYHGYYTKPSLQDDGCAELDIGIRVCGSGISDPVGNNDSDGDEPSFDGNHTSSRACLRGFCLVPIILSQYTCNLYESLGITHIGTVLVLIPFPNPVTTRPTIIWGIEKADVCRIVPIIIIANPNQIAFFRPSLSPLQNVKTAPKKHPIS